MRPTFDWKFFRKGTRAPTTGAILQCDTHAVVASNMGAGAIVRGAGDRWVIAFWMPWSKGEHDKHYVIKSADMVIVEVKRFWEENYVNVCEAGPPK